MKGENGGDDDDDDDDDLTNRRREWLDVTNEMLHVRILYIYTNTKSKNEA